MSSMHGVLRDGLAIAIVVVATVFRLPAWGLLWLLQPWLRIRSIFLMYPGSERDFKAYVPDFLRLLARTPLIYSRPSIVGFIRCGDLGNCLVLGVPNNAVSALRNEKEMVQITSRLHRIGRLLGVRAIAMAGQFPSIARRQGLDIFDRGSEDGPVFVGGIKGANFMIYACLVAAIHRNLAQGFSPRIAIFGFGMLGASLRSLLLEYGYQVEAIDLRKQTGVSPVHSVHAQEILAKSDVVIVLADKGSDFYPHVPYLRPGTIVLDDTHPRMRKAIPGLKIFKIAAKRMGLWFVPRIPGYHPTWIPGCAIEAVVVSVAGEKALKSQVLFDRTALDLGFEPVMGAGHEQ